MSLIPVNTPAKPWLSPVEPCHSVLEEGTCWSSPLSGHKGYQNGRQLSGKRISLVNDWNEGAKRTCVDLHIPLDFTVIVSIGVASES